MNYPSPPWNLQGYAIQSLNLVDLEQARAVIPSELTVVSVFPGKTLGGIYLSTYQFGSPLQYSELIIVPGLTRYGDRLGAWISHIYVGDRASVAGGREVWGLPKEMAEFTWEGDRVTVKQDTRLLCSLQYRSSWFNLATWWQPQFSAQVFSSLDRDLLLFTNQFSADIGLLSGSVTIPHNSPFASLALAQPWFTFKLDRLNLTAGVPETVGEKSTIARNTS